MVDGLVSSWPTPWPGADRPMTPGRSARHPAFTTCWHIWSGVPPRWHTWRLVHLRPAPMFSHGWPHGGVQHTGGQRSINLIDRAPLDTTWYRCRREQPDTLTRGTEEASGSLRTLNDRRHMPQSAVRVCSIQSATAPPIDPGVPTEEAPASSSRTVRVNHPEKPAGGGAHARIAVAAASRRAALPCR